MKGFIKDGKFRPTGNRNKSSLTVKDLREFEAELDKGDQMLEHRDRLKQQGASSIQHDKLILAQKKKLNKMSKVMKLKARNKNSFGRTKPELMQILKDKGLEYEFRTESDPDDEEEKVTYVDVDIPTEKVLELMNGKRTAKDIVDEATGLTESERLHYDIDVDTHLLTLMNDKKAKSDGNHVWHKVN